MILSELNIFKFVNTRAVFLAVAVLGSSFAYAQQGPSSLNISGSLFQADGNAITAANVNFKIEIYDKAGGCLLYSENHLGEDLSNTKGGFSLQIGQGSSINNAVDASNPAVMTSKVFENSGSIAGGWAGCASGATLAAGDNRVIRVQYDLGGGYVAMSPDVPIEAAAYSIIAETLQGLRPADLIQVHDDVANKLTQANVENIFSATNYPKLTDLLSGTSASYISSNPTSAVSFNNQLLTNVASPVAATDATNKDYVDSNIGGQTADLSGIGPATGDGYTLIWDKTAGKWTTGVPSATDNTKLPLAGGTMTGTIDFAAAIGTGINLNGNDLIGTGHITMSPLKTLTLGAFTSAQETTLIGTLTAANAGASWYNTTSNTFKIWNGTTAISQTFTGATAGGDLTGTYPNPTIADDKIVSNMIDSAGVARNRLVISDQTTGANLQFATCSTNEVLRYEDLNGWVCRDPSAIVTFPVTKVNGKTGDITLNANDLGLGTAALEDVGTDPGNVPQLDGSGKIPSSLLPAGMGTITGVTAGTGLSGGGTSGTVTLDLADTVVTPGIYGTAGKVATFTVDQQGRLTAASQTDISIGDANITGVDGSKVSGDIAGNAAGFTGNLAGDVTGPQGTTVVGKIQGRTIAATAPNPNEVLMWNDTDSQWEPAPVPSAPVTSVAGRTGAVTLDYGDINNAAGKYLTYKPNNVACGNDEILKFDGTNWICSDISTLGTGDFMKDGSVAMTGNLKLGTNYISNDGGAGEGLAFDTSGNANFTGKIGIGTATPGVSLDIQTLDDSPTIRVQNNVSSVAQHPQVAIVNIGAENGGFPQMSWYNYRTGLAAAQTNDFLGVFHAYGSNGSAAREGASIVLLADTPWTGSSNPGAIAFATTTDGLNAPTEKMRVSNAGNVGIGTAAPSQLLDVNGPVRVAPAALPTSPTAGVLAFDSGTSNTLKYYNGSAWQTVGTGTGSGDFMKDGSVTMTGNLKLGANYISNDGGANEGLAFDTSGNANFTGNIGIGTATSSSNLSFTGQSNQTIAMERNSTSNTAGKNLTIQAGGAAVGASDKAGGDLNLSTGVSTGTGSIPNINFLLSDDGAAATTDNATYKAMSLNSLGLQLNYWGAGTNNFTNGLLIENTKAGSDGAAVLGLAHSYNGISGVVSGDGLGRIDFLGYTATGGRVRGAQIRSAIPDATASSEKTTISFATMAAGTLADRMTIDGDGEIGIGTTAPGRLLHVNGPMRLTPTTLPLTPAAGDLAFDSGAANALKFYDGTAWQTVGTGTGSGDFMKDGSVAMTGNLKLGANYISNDGGASEGLAFDTSGNANFTGNVGIGTTSPVSNLVIDGGITSPKTPIVIIKGNSSGIGFGSYGATTTQANSAGALIAGVNNYSGESSGQSTHLAFYTSDRTGTDTYTGLLERMRISTAGNVGIGTTAPARLLHVNGPMRLTPAALPLTPAAGDLAFDSGAANALKFYDGSAWQTVGTGSGAGDFKKDGSVAMTGNFNAGGNKVLGNTTASASLTLESTSHATKGNVYINPSGGKIGIGTTAVGATDFLAIENTGGQNVVIDKNATGSWVGIGAEPETTLHVLSNDTTWGGAIFENTDTSANTTYTTLNNSRRVSTVGAGVGTSFIMNDSVSNRAEYGYFGAIIDGNTAGSHNGSIAFFPAKNGARTEAVRITSSGNVGIGTTSPTRLLDINGAMRMTPLAAAPTSPAAGDLYIDSTASNALKYYDGSAWQSAGGGSASAGGSSGQVQFNSSSALAGSANFVWDNTNSRLGLGVASPTQPLDVSGFTRSTAFMSASDGNQANPAFRLGAGAGTGMFGIGGAVAFAANGTEYVRLTSTGNVGIGTTAPTAPLEVVGGTANFTRAQNDQWGSNFVVRKNRAGAIVQNADEIGYLNFDAYDGSVYRTGASITAAVDAAPGANDMPTRMTFSTTPDGSGTNVERMRITSAGNVGIGTTTPARPLDINGAMRMTPLASAPTSPAAGDLYIDSTASNALKYYDGSAWQSTGGGGGSGDFKKDGSVAMTGNIQLNGHYLSGDGGNEGVYVDNSGYVGIGTATPAAPVHVHVGTNKNFIVQQSGGSGVILTSVDDVPMNWQPMQIDASTTALGMKGNVGVGTTSPQSALHLEGTQRISNGSNAFTISGSTSSPTSDNVEFKDLVSSGGYTQLGIWGASPTTSTFFVVRQGTSPKRFFYGIDSGGLGRIENEAGDLAIFSGTHPGTERARFMENGNVGIGTTAPSEKLEVAGNIKMTGLGNGITFPDGTTQMTAATGGGGGSGDFMKDGSVAMTGNFSAGGNSVQNVGSLTGSSSADLQIAAQDKIPGIGNSISIQAGKGSGIGGSITLNAANANLTYAGSEAGNVNINAGSGGDHDSQINFNGNQMVILRNSGLVGIGTTTPGAKLEIASGTANVSGLKFTNFNSSSPTSVGQAVGVDSNGNLVTVAGGGGGLTNFTEAVNTTSPNATIPVVSLVANNAATNVDIALSPKGTGSLAAHVADSSTTGGSKRGTYAVDWQLSRTASNQVASGVSAVIGGGQANIASGNSSTVAGGLYNTASNTYATVAGGSSNTASGQYGAIAGGYSNATTGPYTAVLGGYGNSAAAQYAAVGGGRSNTASGQSSFTAGFFATADSYSQTTFGSYNLPKGGENTSTWVATDPLFVIGNGTSAGAKSNALMILKNGNVGIGTTTPNSKLEVTGNVAIGSQATRATASSRGQLSLSSTYTQTANANVTIDWNNGNIQELATFACAAGKTITFSNMNDGGAYSLLLSGSASHTGTCLFSGTGLTFKTSGGATAPASGKDVLFTFAVIGGNVVYSMVDNLQ